MISFIIPAYNEEALIQETVSHLVKAADELKLDYEIIVADDDSNDKTAQLATSSGAKVVLTSNRQIAATRNAGAKAAKGDIFIFVDADTLVPAKTLKAALAVLDNGAVGGGATIKFRGKISAATHLITFLAQLPMRLAKLTGGCFMFMTRNAFEEAGGFDESIYASEEIWLAINLKKQGQFVVLREIVLSSGRKIRQYGMANMLFIFAKIALRGPSAIANRDRLDLWYKSKREAGGADDS